MKKKTITKKILKIVLAVFCVVILCISGAIFFSPQKSFAGWAFEDYDQGVQEINYTFNNYNWFKYNGTIIQKSSNAQLENTWSSSLESHTFGNYAIGVNKDNIVFFYTRESGSNWDRDLVMKINFTLYRKNCPNDKYTFQVIKYDGSDNDGREDNTGYLTDIRNTSGDLIPVKYQESTITGIEYLYPTFYLDYPSLEDALNSGVWILQIDCMKIYDDKN